MSEEQERRIHVTPMDQVAQTMPTGSPRFIPTLTQEEFLAATAEGPAGEMRVLILEGSRGEGKTATGLMACIELAKRVHREGRGKALPIRVGCVRDTWVNLQRTTLVSIEEAARKGIKMQWKDARRECIIQDRDGKPVVHIYFFGLDVEADTNKLQGFVMAILWLEEVAAAEGLDSGIPSSSLALGGTSLRQPDIPWPRILVTMNPPDEEHWIGNVEEELANRGLASIKVHRFLMRPGEKSEHFRTLAIENEQHQEVSEAWRESADEFDRYRERNRALLESIGRHDLVTRLVEGQRGGVQVGEPVIVNFSKEHISKDPLNIYKSLPIYRGWDQEPNPAVCLYQVLPHNMGINVLGSHVEENATMEQIIKGWLLPWMSKVGIMTRGAADSSWGRGPRGGVQFVDIGDPVFLNQQISAGQILQRMLNTSLTPGPVEWEARRAAGIAAFERGSKSGRRFVLIEESENTVMIHGLQGRFRYPKNRSTGRVVMSIEAAKRVSGKYSNPIDAMLYGFAVTHPAIEWLRQTMRRPVPPPRESPKGWQGA